MKVLLSLRHIKEDFYDVCRPECGYATGVIKYVLTYLLQLIYWVMTLNCTFHLTLPIIGYCVIEEHVMINTENDLERVIYEAQYICAIGNALGL